MSGSESNNNRNTPTTSQTVNGHQSSIPANPRVEAETTTTTINLSPQNLVNQSGVIQALRDQAARYSVSSGAGNYGQSQTSFLSRVQQAYGAGFTFRPNVLDKYANYTYHIRWSMTSDRTAYSVTSADGFRSGVTKTVIAESGVTAGFNIIDFEMKNYCSPGPRVRTTMHTEFKMTIKEPYGFSLIDKVYSVSKLMGIRNYLTSPCFIEIWFTGYNEDGTIATEVLSTEIYKLFRVNITKMESETSSSGTTYHITGQVDGAFGNSDNVSIVGSGINIGPVTTVGQFFDQLAVELNTIQSRLDYDNTSRIEYQVNVPTWMRNWAFSQEPTNSQRNSEIIKRSGGTVTQPTISISRGMDINTILYFVISMTREGQDWVAGETAGQQSASAQSGVGASISANGMANLITIHTGQEIIGFDTITNDYVRRITYTFAPHPTARAMIDRANITTTSQPDQQISRAATLASSRRYSKHYQYIYTGQNLDVLKFDIKLEWFWQTPIPSQLGENVYSNFTQGPQYSQGSVGNTLAQQYNRARQRKAVAQQQQIQAETALRRNPNDETARQQQSNAAREIDAANADLQAINANGGAQNFQIRWENRSPGSQAIENIRIGAGLSANDQVVSTTLAQNLLWSAATEGRRDTYLEDVKVIEYQTRPLPLSSRPDNSPITQTTSVGSDGPTQRTSSTDSPANLPNSRSLVSAVLNDVTSSPYFVDIELEIRGDPYWMGVGNVNEASMIGDGNTPIQATGDNAWFYSGDVGFVLSYRTGQAPSEETGLMEFDNGTMAFEGLYNAYEINNMFKDGKFTQVIKANRDMLTNPPSSSAQQ